MANKVTMTIAGEEYTFVADENAAYMEKVCGIVDKRMTQLTDAKVSRSDAAVLAAVNRRTRRRTCAARSSPISTRSPISSASSSRRRTSRATSKTASDGEGIDGASLARRLARGA